MTKPAITADQIADALGVPLDRLKAALSLSPEGLAEAERIASRKARVNAAYDSAAKAADDALAARMRAPEPPQPLQDHGHRLSALLPAGAIAFSQGGQAGHRELSQRDRDLIERDQSTIGAVRAAEGQELDSIVTARPAFGGMKLAHLALAAWSAAGQCYLFWYSPKLEAFKLSDLQLAALARFVKGGDIAITAAEFDMQTELEAFRRGQRASDPRKDAELEAARARLAELEAA